MKTINDFAKYISECEFYQTPIRYAILDFLQANPEILADVYTDLSNLVYKKMCELQHKVKIKDQSLECVRGWITGDTYKDKQFHGEQEYRDQMVENIDRALNCGRYVFLGYGKDIGGIRE